MVTCLLILNEATFFLSLPSYLRMVMFVLMVLCIPESLPSLSSTMDLLHQLLMVIYCGNILGILLLHLTHHCHPYSQHLQKRT